MAIDVPHHGKVTGWYSLLGFHFSRRQLIRGSILLVGGVVTFWVVFLFWYLPPRQASRLVRSVGGHVQYRPDEGPLNAVLHRLVYQQTQLLGLKQPDDEVEAVQLINSPVSDNWLKHLRPLEGLSRLDLHERQLGPGLQQLAELPNLTDVGIWDLCSGDMKQLQKLPKLRRIRLSRPACSNIDLSELARLPNLISFSQWGSSISERQLEQISRIAALHELYLQDAKMDGDQAAGVALLAKVPNLQILSLNELTDVSAAELVQMEKLIYLAIGNTRLSKKGLDLLATLQKLEQLELHRFSENADVETLRQRMPRCRVLCYKAR